MATQKMRAIKRRLTKAQREYVEQKASVEYAQRVLEERRKDLAKTCEHPDEMQEPWIYNESAVGWKCQICLKYNATILGGSPSYRQLDEATAILITYCPHPSFAVIDYEWEHDNGYGVQSKVVGERCMICRSKKHWRGSSLWVSYANQER